MTTGTKSVLFGAHAFWLHPFFVAYAWWKLYGFPWDPRLWFAFFLHDIGYIGKHKMDDEIGETHPEMGASIMEWLFGKEWGDFTLYHSRYYSNRNGAKFSGLCVADKYAIAITPAFVYLPMVMATGELSEYMANGLSVNIDAIDDTSVRDALRSIRWGAISMDKSMWYFGLQQYMKLWVGKHRDGAEDTWTRKDRNQ